MNNEDKINDNLTTHPAPKPPQRHQLLLVAIVAALLCAVVGWAFLMFNPMASFVMGCVALALSVAGLWIGRCCWRDIAITLVIASAVLLLVHIIFYAAVDYALATL